jgi:ectoine hydroxylase-related dioxygenase (phytanoyl-CoA dioxygenase family)
MRNMLQHEEMNKALEEQGYIVLQVLNAAEISSMMQLYQSLPSLKNEHFGFHVSLDLQDMAVKKQVHEKISAALANSLQKLLHPYRCFSGRFAVKEAMDNSYIPAHQDWTFVNEELYNSYNVWTALHDIDPENGGLYMVPQSHHRFLNRQRATPLPIFKCPCDGMQEEMMAQAVPITLKAGQAVIFNSRLVHGSFVNKSDQARIAMAMEITEAEAPLLHYYLSPDTANTLYEYAIDESFFYKYSNAVLHALYRSGKYPESYPLIKTVRFNG